MNLNRWINFYYRLDIFMLIARSLRLDFINFYGTKLITSRKGNIPKMSYQWAETGLNSSDFPAQFIDGIALGDFP